MVVMVLLNGAAISQTNTRTDVYSWVEEMPKFNGGEDSLFKYISNNIRYPKIALMSNVQGTVYVNFIINPDGKVSDVKVLRGIGSGCDEEALRVVQSMPDWNPGTQLSKKVSVTLNLPIKFKLGSSDSLNK